MKKKPKNMIYWFEPMEGQNKSDGGKFGKVWYFRYTPQNSREGWYTEGTVPESRVRALLSPSQFQNFKQGQRRFIKEITREMKYEAVKKRYTRKKRKKA